MDTYEDLLPSPWDCLMESLVERDLVPLLNQQGIHVEYTATHLKRMGRHEFDIMAANSQEVVMVEVRTTLRVDDVKDFLDRLRKLTTRDSYQGRTVYGAVAWLKAKQKAAIFAEKQGLFVIRATGSSASIVNQENFKPQVFS